MSALRAPAILLAVIVASELLGAPAARARRRRRRRRRRGRGRRRRRGRVPRSALRAALRHRRRRGARQPQDREVDHRRRGRRAGPGAGRRGRCVRPARRGGRATGCWRSATSSTCGCRSRAAPAAAASSWSSRSRSAAPSSSTSCSPAPAPRPRSGAARTSPRPTSSDAASTWAAASSASTTPVVPGATAGLGLRLRATVPPIGGPYGLSLSVTGLYNDGSEFYRVTGAADDSDPRDFVASRVQARRRRARRRQGLPVAPAPGARLSRGGGERRAARGPGRAARRRFHDQRRAASRVGSVTASLDLDTRSDPILPRSGMRVALSRRRARAACSVPATTTSRRVAGGVVLPADAARARARASTCSAARSSATRRTSIGSSSAI